jgi:hypothetical protein
MVTAEPFDRLAVSSVRECLENKQPPAALLDADTPRQGAWKVIADDALRREVVPPYFDPSYVLPPFLAGLGEVPVPATMEDAVLVLAAAAECDVPEKEPHFDVDTAWRGLQVSRRRVDQTVAKWAADADGAHAASLSLDREGLVAIAFYTSDGVYAAMNAALRSGQRWRVLPFLPYLRLLLQVRRVALAVWLLFRRPTGVAHAPR